jgi:hypothetical protein
MEFDPVTYFGLTAEAVKEPEKRDKIRAGQQISKHSDGADWMVEMFGGDFNPDDLGYEEYDEMLKDPQIKTGISFLVSALLSKKPVITPGGESTQDEEVKTFLEDMLNNMSIPFRSIRKDMYTSLEYGYSVGEIIWDVPDSGSLQGKIIVDRVKSVPISTLENCFSYDEYGNLVEILQTVEGEDESIPLPVDKCLVYSFDERFGNKYGQSILSQVYDNYFMKSQILKWFAVYLQKHAGPTLVGKVGPESDAVDLLDQLDGIQEGRQNMVVEGDDDVSILESGRGGEQFLNAVQYHDAVIFRRFMIGTLIFGQAGDASGSYAQSQTHLDALKLFLDGVHEEIAGVLEGLVKRVVDMNFNVDKYPTFRFEPFTDKDLLMLLGVMSPLAEKLIVNPESKWFRDLITVIMEHYGDITIDEDEWGATGGGIPGGGMGGGVRPPTMVESTPVPTMPGVSSVADKIRDSFPMPGGGK